MSKQKRPSRNIGLDIIRVTETAALAAGRWIGSGDFMGAHRHACQAMRDALDTLDMNGLVVFGEEDRLGKASPLCSGQIVGTGDGPNVDVIVDPIDGTRLMVRGLPGAISIVCVAPQETVWSPVPAQYMEKIIVDQEVADVLVPECMDAPAAWTLALIARAKEKAVRDLGVIVLDRPRHRDLIDEIRTAGARVFLRDEGDAEGALVTVTKGTGVDAVMGIGGASQGIMAACAAKAMGGGMLARLAPQSDEEKEAVEAAGLDIKRIWTQDEIVNTDQIFVAVTGITNSVLLSEMQFYSTFSRTYSLLIRAETGTRRSIEAEHTFRL